MQGQYLKARNDVVRAILDGKDLEEYERGSSPQAMVYRAAFLRDRSCRRRVSVRRRLSKDHGGDRGLFCESKRKAGIPFRFSMSVCRERLRGRKAYFRLFLAWKFYLLEGMPVLYLGNKELLITVEVLNNINQFPESYDLYIEKKDMEKRALFTGNGGYLL